MTHYATPLLVSLILLSLDLVTLPISALPAGLDPCAAYLSTHLQLEPEQLTADLEERGYAPVFNGKLILLKATAYFEPRVKYFAAKNDIAVLNLAGAQMPSLATLKSTGIASLTIKKQAYYLITPEILQDLRHVLSGDLKKAAVAKAVKAPPKAGARQRPRPPWPPLREHPWRNALSPIVSH